MKCPICGFPLDNKTYHDDEYLVEDYYECNKCGLYRYEYSYGVEGQCIGNKSFSDSKKHTLYVLWTRLLYNLRKLGDLK